MAEYTARCAARDTRRAIARAEKALEQLRNCAVHWADLDHSFESDVGSIEVPQDIVRLKEDLDEVYPTRAKGRMSQ